jgi:phospholipid/cholesterol/gamma-HCH transport system substrate-binding protein
MAENRAEVLAGFGIVALALGFLAYAGVGQLGNSAGTYDLTASFRSANGIAVVFHRRDSQGEKGLRHQRVA